MGKTYNRWSVALYSKASLIYRVKVAFQFAIVLVALVVHVPLDSQGRINGLLILSLEFKWYSLTWVTSFVISICISTEDSATTLTHAFITCKLDNLNSLLTGPYMDTKLNRLQLIQNHAARIITRTKKFDHISGVLKKLHWLPIKATIDYKVLLLVLPLFHWPS